MSRRWTHILLLAIPPLFDHNYAGRRSGFSELTSLPDAFGSLVPQQS